MSEEKKDLTAITKKEADKLFLRDISHVLRGNVLSAGIMGVGFTMTLFPDVKYKVLGWASIGWGYYGLTKKAKYVIGSAAYYLRDPYDYMEKRHSRGILNL